MTINVSRKDSRTDATTIYSPPCSYLDNKVFFDSIVACILLLGSLPLLAILAAVVRLTSKGSSLYRQRRVGKNGRIFTLYKLRTMSSDAEENIGPVWSTDIKNDPRVTAVGRFLRRFHLDELPQLINVIRGEMALFGPRPERPEIVRGLQKVIDGYDDRHTVRPGITGLAQVNLPADTNIESVRRKLYLDLEYIESATPEMDFRIFVWTSLRLMLVPSKVAGRITKLNRTIDRADTQPNESPVVAPLDFVSG